MKQNPFRTKATLKESKALLDAWEARPKMKPEEFLKRYTMPTCWKVDKVKNDNKK